MIPLDPEFVRSQFPAFSEPALRGWAFFENAGGSYPCQQVIRRLTSYYRETKIQPYGPYPASCRAGIAMDESYTRLAGYLNVAEDELHFGPSTSQNTYVLAQAFRSLWKPGDEIVVSGQDHEANAGAWRRLAEQGMLVKEWPVDPESGQLAPDDLDQLLSEKTRLVAFPHCSNLVGHVNPVREIASKAHAVGATVVTDGVAYAPHGFPDVSALGADIYLFSLYKTYGPHQGLMTVARHVLDQLPNQGHFFNAEDARKKLVPAGPDHAQIAAAAGIAEYFDAVHAHHFSEDATDAIKGRRVHDLFRAQERSLLTPLLDWLRERTDLRLVGPGDAAIRAPTVSLVPLRREISAVMEDLVQHKIMAGSGHFYAVRPLQGMRIPRDPGVLRLSFLHYTTPEEVAQLIVALEAAL